MYPDADFRHVRRSTPGQQPSLFESFLMSRELAWALRGQTGRKINLSEASFTTTVEPTVKGRQKSEVTTLSRQGHGERTAELEMSESVVYSHISFHEQPLLKSKPQVDRRSEVKDWQSPSHMIESMPSTLPPRRHSSPLSQRRGSGGKKPETWRCDHLSCPTELTGAASPGNDSQGPILNIQESHATSTRRYLPPSLPSPTLHPPHSQPDLENGAISTTLSPTPRQQSPQTTAPRPPHKPLNSPLTNNISDFLLTVYPQKVSKQPPPPSPSPNQPPRLTLISSSSSSSSTT